MRSAHALRFLSLSSLLYESCGFLTPVAGPAACVLSRPPPRVGSGPTRRTTTTNEDERDTTTTWQFSFSGASPISYWPSSRKNSALASRRLEDEIDENVRRRAAARQQRQGGGGGVGIGETAAGAILGGLLLGPFGALFGASLGSNLGAKNAVDRARKEEMERMGITQDMLDTAREVGLALETSAEGLRATQDSLETQQRLARRLEAEVERLHDRARQALADGQEDQARKLLLDRQNDLDKLKQVLRNCADERQRLGTMERNVEALERRAMEVEALLKRTMGAKSQVDASSALTSNVADDSRFALSSEDPLLQKFRDMGID